MNIIKRPYLDVYPEYFKWYKYTYPDTQVASPDVFTRKAMEYLRYQSNL